MGTQQVVLVTGASSGIGRATAELLAAKGYCVYGTSRKGGDVTATGIHMLPMEVTDEDSVQSAVQGVMQQQGRIDVLVNAAGNGIAGAVEDCSGADALSQMDVNYVGTLRVIRAVLPHMRKARNGMIINIGSVAGLFSIPFQTLYSSSKYALEALTEGLRIEVKPYGIRVCIVEPGDVHTGFTGSRRYAAYAATTAYREEMSRAVGRMVMDERQGKPPITVAEVVWKVMRRKHPPVRRVVGVGYRFLAVARRLLGASADRLGDRENLCEIQIATGGNLVIRAGCMKGIGGNTMDTMEAIITRRSIRAFTGTPLDKGTITALVRAGMYAPSAHNNRTWEIITIEDKETLNELSGYSRYWYMLKEASVGFVICGNPQYESDSSAKAYFLQQNSSAATQNILLAAHAMGLGGVWMGTHPEQDRHEMVKELLDIPDDVIVVSLIAVGHPAAKAVQPPERLEMEKWHTECW